MNNVHALSMVVKFVSIWRLPWSVLALVAVVGVAACDSSDKKNSQSLVRVNGKEITVLQLNDELQRANVTTDERDDARKNLLESLIDRQLLVEEAMLNKIDRRPDVVGAIERAKAQIIAQAYLQGVTSKVAKPSRAEINDYFRRHPEFFSKRKEFILTQLIISNKNFSNELRVFIKSAKTLEEVAGWMVKHGVQFLRGQVIRSSMDLPSKAVEKLLELPKGQLFVVSEGDNRVLNVIAAIKDSPVTEANAAPLIEQFLDKEKVTEAEQQEIAQLRSRAKIEYLNVSSVAAAQTQTTPADNKATGPE